MRYRENNFYRNNSFCQIGKLDPGNYKLVAEGPAELPFVKEILINFPSKNQSVFIQTDKAMYKPGDKVKFRVLVLDSELNPGIINKMDVYITVREMLEIAEALLTIYEFRIQEIIK